MPPSLMIPVFLPFGAFAASMTAVICGTPVPATIRRGADGSRPDPNFTASAPASAECGGRFGGTHIAGYDLHVHKSV